MQENRCSLFFETPFVLADIFCRFRKKPTGCNGIHPNVAISKILGRISRYLMDGSFAGTVAVVGYAVADHAGNGANIDNTGGTIRGFTLFKQ